MDETGRCPDHPDEVNVRRCRTCGRVFCDRCQEGINAGSPQCPVCFALEATTFLDAADETDWPDLL